MNGSLSNFHHTWLGIMYYDDDVIWRKQKIWKQTKQLVVT